MALARAWAVALTGVTGHLIAVEADLAAGLPGTTVIGMGDAAVTQARDRIRAAVVNSGQKWPDRRITLALSPAALPKRGAGYDIALAVAVLAAAGVVPPRAAGGHGVHRGVGVGRAGAPGAGGVAGAAGGPGRWPGAGDRAGRESGRGCSGDRDVGVGGGGVCGI